MNTAMRAGVVAGALALGVCAQAVRGGSSKSAGRVRRWSWIPAAAGVGATKEVNQPDPRAVQRLRERARVTDARERAAASGELTLAAQAAAQTGTERVLVATLGARLPAPGRLDGPRELRRELTGGLRAGAALGVRVRRRREPVDFAISGSVAWPTSRTFDFGTASSPTVTMGDATGAHDPIGVFLEGSQVDTMSTAANQLAVRSYRVTIADGALTLLLDDLGGADASVAIDGLEVRWM